jgi:cytochrome P450
LLLSDAEKATLAEIAHRLGRKALEELAAVAKPDTLLAWYRKLIANKFDGSKFRQRVGRPRIDEEAERLVVQMAKENPGWATIVSWVPGKSRLPAVGSDGGQHSPSAWPRSCS